MQLRHAEPSDADAVAALHLAGWQQGYAGLLPAEHLAGLDAEASRARWRAQLGNGDRRTMELVAELADTPHSPGTADTVDTDGDLMGFVMVGPALDRDREIAQAELMALYVTPSRWRRGIGAALHDGAITLMLQQGAREAVVWVLAGNERALAFYRSRGWIDDGLQRTETVDGVAIVDVRLRRRLLRQSDSAAR